LIDQTLTQVAGSSGLGISRRSVSAFCAPTLLVVFGSMFLMAIAGRSLDRTLIQRSLGKCLRFRIQLFSPLEPRMFSHLGDRERVFYAAQGQLYAAIASQQAEVGFPSDLRNEDGYIALALELEKQGLLEEKMQTLETTKGEYVFTAHLGIGFANADRSEEFTVEDLDYEKEEWDALTEEQRQSNLYRYVEDWSQNFIEQSWAIGGEE
jgi:hypothetical protein